MASFTARYPPLSETCRLADAEGPSGPAALLTAKLDLLIFSILYARGPCCSDRGDRRRRLAAGS